MANGPIRLVRNNEIQFGNDDEAEYELDDTSGILSYNANLIPMTSAVQSPRSFYGARFFEQALPMVKRQAPLVRNLNASNGRSWDWTLGSKMGALRAESDGVVEKVTPDEVHLKLADGTKVIKDLYNLFPGNRKTLIHNTAKVTPGQEVKAGDLLAASNFTDDEGRTALGTNLRIGVSPYKGRTMDDAVTISASAAKELTSDHAEVLEQEPDDSLKGGKNHFVALFHKKYTTDQLDKLGDDGVVKPGTILSKGDPIMLFTKPKSFSSQSEGIGNLARGAKFTRKDASQKWSGDDDAEVIDVAHTRDGGVKVLVRYQSPAREADKIVLRNGAKGTISKIVPDEKMPRTADGRPLHLLLNELSLPSRVNAATFHELLLGKIAEKTGKAYTIPAFTDPKDNWIDYVDRELKKNGIEKEERVYDPEEDRYLDEAVTVGVGHVLKLHHLAAGKMSSRGASSYSIDQQPLKGGGAGGGAQRLSSLEMSALQSAGARGIQKEALLLRGEKRDDFWKALRNNRALPQLDKPFAWYKFQALLNGSGVHAKDLGKGRLRLTPMTDKELKNRGSVEIKNDGIVDLSDFAPRPGGLFDPDMVREQKWGHISLPFPVVNPAYEESIRTILGLTKKELEELIDRDEIPEDEKRASMKELEGLLKGIDLEKMREDAYAEIRSGKKTKRQRGVKILRAVDGLQRAGVDPGDLVIRKVPVLPAGFRPYTVAGSTFIPGDANELYSDLIKARDVYRENEGLLGSRGSAPAAKYLRDAVRATYGYQDSPNPKIRSRKVSGFLQKILGNNPKHSWVHSKLLAKPQDFVGRGVVSPDPDLGMDEISIPEKMAWDLYDARIQQSLVGQGIASSRARIMIRDKQPGAKHALEQAMKKYPVMYSRAPAWHKHNTISGYANISKGDNIYVSPFNTAGLTMDFDGDTAAVHLPILPDAIKDAQEKLLPSKMLFSVRDRNTTLAIPKHEQILGVASAQLNPSGAVHRFPTREAALAGIRSGQVKLQDEVEIDPNPAPIINPNVKFP